MDPPRIETLADGRIQFELPSGTKLAAFAWEWREIQSNMLWIEALRMAARPTEPGPDPTGRS